MPSATYAECLSRTNFSFLRGASHARELAERAKELGLHALGVADDANLAGVVRALQACRDAGVKLLIGARFTPSDGPEIALYAQNRRGYSNLCRLITEGRRRAPKGECWLTCADLVAFAEGLQAILLDARADGFADLRARGMLLQAFRGRCWLATRRHLKDDDLERLREDAAFAKGLNLPLLATNDVLYHGPERQALHDVITSIREGKTVAEAGVLLAQNAERYLKAGDRMAVLFEDYPEALEATKHFADGCDFTLDELRYEYPDEICPTGIGHRAYLRQVTLEGAHRRYPQGIPEKVLSLLEKELGLIAELDYEPYFLTVYDVVRFAREEGILCQGRGSAANSAVCFCLGVTSVDPEHHDLLFERFISKERAEPPDIDVDFENRRREEVMQYIYNKYGRHRAGLVATVITYRRRSALRECAKALGLSADQVEALTKHLDTLSDQERIAERLKEGGIDGRDPRVAMVIALAQELRGFPRHLSQHVGGFVITRGRLDEIVPIENAAMVDRTVIEWDKDDIEEMGMLKMDCLALGMLSAVQRSFRFIEMHQGDRWDLAGVLATDSPNNLIAEGVYDMICEGDTIGVFQIESRAQMQMLPRLKPRCFYDLVIEVAIIRPGPIQGGMVHPYLRRRNGEEPVVYPIPAAEPVLKKTLGVPLFQEQAMQLAMVAAGYTPGEADQLRKDMAAWKRTGMLDQHKARLLKGMAERGISTHFAEATWEQIRGFSGYGFPESHSASFALIVYVSCFLKRYYPAAFCAALINSQPMGFYRPTTLVRDAKEHGVEVRPPDVNFSHHDCTLEEASEGIASEEPETWGHGGPTLRLGLRQIRGVKEDASLTLVAAREAGAFTSIEDFARRTKVDRGTLNTLAEGGAFASLGLTRREAIWRVRAWQPEPPLLAGLESREPSVSLPTMALSDEVYEDYRTLGLSLKAHPLGIVRKALDAEGIVPNSYLKQAREKERVEIAGIVMCRQRPATASGVVFMTLEDESGVANVIVWAKVFEEFRQVARLSKLQRIVGTVQRDATGKVINLIAERLAPLRVEARELTVSSRDFH